MGIRVIGCRVAVPRSHWSAVPTPLFIYIAQLLRDSFSVSQQPPIWEPPSHYSMLATLDILAHDMRQTDFLYMLPYGPKMHILFSFVPKENRFLPSS